MNGRTQLAEEITWLETIERIVTRVLPVLIVKKSTMIPWYFKKRTFWLA